MVKKKQEIAEEEREILEIRWNGDENEAGGRMSFRIIQYLQQALCMKHLDKVQ